MTPPISVADVLERAADLIEPEGAWTTGFAARDAQGNAVLPYSPRAVCWCMEGAIAAITRHKWDSPAFEAEPAYRFLDVSWGWNDARGRTQEQVVAKLREAAAKARSPHVGEDADNG